MKNGTGSAPLLVRVARSDPQDRTEFEVERFAPMTVLDVLLSIQRDHDASLGFRFSCRVAMCGTCTVRVDGRSVLACQSVVPDQARRLDIGPMAGLPVIRDLVVDTAPFWDQWARVTPYLEPVDSLDAPAQVRPDSDERQAIDPSLDCIQCGACFSSCGVAGLDRTFLGPAALTRAMVLISDSRDAAGQRRLDLVTRGDGVDRCHYMYGCSGVCPKGLDPAKAIRQLRTGRTKDR
jgi:succinate dehydrogenase / fumarate reductase iron-sulfur subunit/fumarate reductase iron-sulfur subunit